MHLYQSDVEVLCYLTGYIPFFYLKLYPENAHRIKFLQYIQVCMCICRETHRQTTCVCVCVYTVHMYILYIVPVYKHTVHLQKEQARLLNNVTATSRHTWGNLSLVWGVKHRSLKRSSVVFHLVLGAA